MIVAINKIDKDGANIEKIKQDLLRYDVLPEELGGDVICVPVSAKTGQGVDNLLKTISLQAEMLEISANTKEMACGSIIESKFDKNLGQIATVTKARSAFSWRCVCLRRYLCQN
jgi:translation initiation factor IF-2